LKLVPGGEIFGVEYEAIPILLFSLAGLLLVLVPFLDRRVVHTGRSPGFTIVGIIAVVYMVGMTAWGYRSLVPVWIVGATGAFVWILRWGTKRVRKESAS
jgi:quinol-cytochrome oxidoreductase complex cytochrome b subunit